MPGRDPGKRLARRVPLRGTPRERRGEPAAVSCARVPLRTARDTGPAAKVRALVLARDGGKCAGCGVLVTGGPYSIQHRVARGMGGTSRPGANSPERLVLLCGSAVTGCHGLAESRNPVMHERGLWLYSWEDPAAAPVTYATPVGLTQFWLLPDGSKSARRLPEVGL